MNGEQHPTRVALRTARECVIDHLSDAFAKDEIGLEEFERRIDAAYRCRAPEELARLVADLGPPTNAALAPDPRPALGTELQTGALVPSGASLSVPTRPTTVRAFLGNVERSGRFTLSDHTRAVAVLGNVELDLRDLVLPNGTTHLHVRSVLGNIEITVPPDLAVECEGEGVLGSFTHVNRVPVDGGHDGPVLRIIGLAVLGSVAVRTRPRGHAPTVGCGTRTRRALPAKR
jgi:hypothetical protein